MLLAARSAFTARKRLPYDAEIEYLESTGTQYIDTGVNADSKIGYQLTAQATQSTVQRMGAIVLSPSVIRHHISVPEADTYNNLVGFGFNVNVYSGGIMDANVHIFTMSAVRGVCLVDNVQLASFQAQSFDCGMNWLAFARNSDQGITGASMRIMALILTYNEVWVRDFIPVRKGNVGYMYDKISKKLFGNKGTGDFLLGPDVRLSR